MVTQVNSDALFEQSQALAAKSVDIYKDVDNLTAESVEKAERMYDASVDLMEKSDTMRTLEAKRANVISNLEDDRKDLPADDVSSKAMQTSQKDNFGYESVGNWLKAIFHLKANNLMSKNGLVWWDGDGDKKRPAIHITESKELAENVGATGGFLVPQEFQARVLQIAEEQLILSPRAETIRMTRREVKIPSLDQTGTVTSGASWFGGAVAYWEAEGATMTESSPDFRDTTLTAHNLTAFTRTTNQLLDDSAVSLQDFIMNLMPRVLAHKIETAFFQGDGVGKPQGIISAGATITVNRAGTNNVTYDDITSMLANMLPSSTAIWVASQSVLSTLLTMNGPSGNPSYLWGSAERGVPASLLGRPIFFSDKLPALGTAGDIMIIDPSYYLKGDRQATTLDMSIHESFTSNKSTWRAISRVDGQPWLSAPITYQDGSTQVSPFVILGDKST